MAVQNTKKMSVGSTTTKSKTTTGKGGVKITSRAQSTPSAKGSSAKASSSMNKSSVSRATAKSAKNPNYIQNLGKEVKQFAKSWSKSVDATDKARYAAPSDRAVSKRQASSAAKKYDAAKGQLIGAVFQGRRYDDKTGSQIKAGKMGTIKKVKK